jgi:hypothetical protein
MRGRTLVDQGRVRSLGPLIAFRIESEFISLDWVASPRLAADTWGMPRTFQTQTNNSCDQRRLLFDDFAAHTHTHLARSAPLHIAESSNIKLIWSHDV